MGGKSKTFGPAEFPATSIRAQTPNCYFVEVKIKRTCRSRAGECQRLIPPPAWLPSLALRLGLVARHARGLEVRVILHLLISPAHCPCLLLVDFVVHLSCDEIAAVVRTVVGRRYKQMLGRATRGNPRQRMFDSISAPASDEWRIYLRNSRSVKLRTRIPRVGEIRFAVRKIWAARRPKCRRNACA